MPASSGAESLDQSGAVTFDHRHRISSIRWHTGSLHQGNGVNIRRRSGAGLSGVMTAPPSASSPDVLEAEGRGPLHTCFPLRGHKKLSIPSPSLMEIPWHEMDDGSDGIKLLLALRVDPARERAYRRLQRAGGAPGRGCGLHAPRRLLAVLAAATGRAAELPDDAPCRRSDGASRS